MNENKVCFIYCVNNQGLFEESLRYIRSLKIPEGYEVDVISINYADSICSGYNQAMEQSDAKYKVYLHQDVFIINQNFLFDIIKLFKENSTLGMLGVAGAKTIPMSGVWWESNQKVGQVYDSHTGKMELLEFDTPSTTYESVSAIDGLIMITQYDIPWRENLFDGWHFYDLSQCQEFIKAGYNVGIPKQHRPWCIHDCGIVNVSNGFDISKRTFLKEYKSAFFNELPLVSILIPAYNQTSYLKEALESAINQTYSNIEIIIGDDSTNDEVQEFLKPYLEKYSHITYFRNKKREMDWGYTNFLNCYQRSKGEYVNFLNHDDIFHPKKIEIMMNYFIENSNVSLVTSARNPINQNGMLLSMNGAFKPLYNTNKIVSGIELSRKVLVNLTNYIGEPTTVLFKKKYIDTDKLFCFSGVRYKSIGDVAMWFTLLQYGNAVYIPNTLSYFRMHSNQNSNRSDIVVNGAISWCRLIHQSYQSGMIKNMNEYKELLFKWLTINIPLIKNFFSNDSFVEEKLKENLFMQYKEVINKLLVD